MLLFGWLFGKWLYPSIVSRVQHVLQIEGNVSLKVVEDINQGRNGKSSDERSITDDKRGKQNENRYGELEPSPWNNLSLEEKRAYVTSFMRSIIKLAQGEFL
jgi:hypothetical protein